MPEQAIGVRAQRVTPPHEHVLRARPTRVVVAVGEPDRIVRLDIRTSHGPEHRRHSGDDARPSAVRVHGVHRTEHVVGHLEVDLARLAASSAPYAHRADAVVLDRLLVLRDDGVERLVPAHALPLVLTAVFTGALHRVEQTVLVVEVLLRRQAAHAQTALADRVFLIAFHLHELAVFNVHFKAAPEVVAPDAGRARAVNRRSIRQRRYHERSGFVVMQCWHFSLLFSQSRLLTRARAGSLPGSRFPSRRSRFAQPARSRAPRWQGRTSLRRCRGSRSRRSRPSAFRPSRRSAW